MPSPSLIPPLNVIAGLVDDASRAAPVPPLEVAAAQLRAINHRLLHGVLDPHGHLMKAMTGEDFLATEHDGAWHDRAGFLARVRQQTPVTGASCEDMRVRLFGPVAVVHAVFGAAHGTASGSGLFQDRGAALADFAKPYFATSIASFPVGKVNIRRFAAHITVHKAVHKAPAM